MEGISVKRVNDLLSKYTTQDLMPSDDLEYKKKIVLALKSVFVAKYGPLADWPELHIDDEIDILQKAI